MRPPAPARARGALVVLLAAVLAGCTSASSVTHPSTTVTTSTSVPRVEPVAAETTPTTPASSPTVPSEAPATVAPTIPWPRASLPAGIDQAAVDTVVGMAMGPTDHQALVRSVVVVRDGAIVYERYHPLENEGTVMASYSVAKSVVSAIVGLLVADGRLQLDQPAPVQAWADPSDPRHAISIADLLHMTSGLRWTEQYAPDSPAVAMFDASVASDLAAALPLADPPGTVWNYSTANTVILAGIVTDTLGGPAAVDRYVHERLLDPIGITSAQFWRDGSGRWLGGVGMDMTTEDFARFGWLFANDGVWNGRRVLPAGWVDYSHTPTIFPDYGAGWWMVRPGAFEAQGLFGQRIIVAPDAHTVIVITARENAAAEPLSVALAKLFLPG